MCRIMILTIFFCYFVYKINKNKSWLSNKISLMIYFEDYIKQKFDHNIIFLFEI